MTPVARRRLLFVLPELKAGGAQRVVLGLLGELDPARHDVALLVLDPSQDALVRAVPPQVRLLAPPAPLQRLGSWGAKWATWWHGRRADVLIAGLEMRATFCVHWAARRLKRPAIGWVHIAFDSWARGLSRKHARRCRQVYADLRHVVFVSRRAEDGMAAWLGHRQAGWRTIPNLFSADGYARAATVGALATEAAACLEAMARRPTLLGLGRLEPRKGFDLLVDAFAAARQRGLEADLVILGEGREREALRARAEGHGIAGHVHLPGHVANPLDWLRAARLYVLSSRIEGLPTTIIEAMTVGTPVVATDCPAGPRELLLDGRVGPLVPMDDPPALAEAILAVMHDDARRQRCIDAGLARARDFAPPAVVAAWEALLADVLTHPDSAPCVTRS